MRHQSRLAKNPRMALQVKNLARLDAADRQAVADRAAAIRRGAVGGCRRCLTPFAPTLEAARRAWLPCGRPTMRARAMPSTAR